MAINTTPNLHTIVICANMLVKKDNKFLVIKRSAFKNDLPNHIHPVGGKVDLAEDPLEGAKRELMEEAGLEVKNIKLEAVITEVLDPNDEKYNTPWLIFHFSGDYLKGETKQTEEGELVWLTSEELLSSNMFPSLKEVIKYIIDPAENTVFARFVYDKERNIIDRKINTT